MDINISKEHFEQSEEWRWVKKCLEERVAVAQSEFENVTPDVANSLSRFTVLQERLRLLKDLLNLPETLS